MQHSGHEASPSGLWCQALRVNLVRRQRMFALMSIPALPEMARATSGLRMEWCLPTMASVVRPCSLRRELQLIGVASTP